MRGESTYNEEVSLCKSSPLMVVMVVVVVVVVVVLVVMFVVGVAVVVVVVVAVPTQWSLPTIRRCHMQDLGAATRGMHHIYIYIYA